MNQYEEFYNQQFSYYQRKYGRDWRISREELIGWWEATGKAIEKFHDSRKHRFCRINPSEPWTLSNVQIETPEMKMVRKKPRIRNSVKEPVTVEEKPRILTKKQWLEEIGNK